MHTLRGGKCIHVINQVRERVGGVYLLDLKDAFSAWFGQRKLKVICHWVWCSLNVSLPRSYRRAAGEKGRGKERDPCRPRLHRKYCRDKRGGSRPPPRSRHSHTHIAHPLVQAVTLAFQYTTLFARKQKFLEKRRCWAEIKQEMW